LRNAIDAIATISIDNAEVRALEWNCRERMALAFAIATGMALTTAFGFGLLPLRSDVCRGKLTTPRKRCQ